jgi:DNA-binding YbaB/EbfC family protein
MGAFQEKLGDIRSEGSSGGGMVTVELNGRMEALAIRIGDEAMEDKEMLQDLVIAAFNNAMEKVRESINQEMGSLAGMRLPGFPS